jgi:hypothetical protein
VDGRDKPGHDARLWFDMNGTWPNDQLKFGGLHDPTSIVRRKESRLHKLMRSKARKNIVSFPAAVAPPSGVGRRYWQI